MAEKKEEWLCYRRDWADRAIKEQWEKDPIGLYPVVIYDFVGLKKLVRIAGWLSSSGWMITAKNPYTTHLWSMAERLLAKEKPMWQRYCLHPWDKLKELYLKLRFARNRG